MPIRGARRRAAAAAAASPTPWRARQLQPTTTTAAAAAAAASPTPFANDDDGDARDGAPSSRRRESRPPIPLSPRWWDVSGAAAAGKAAAGGGVGAGACDGGGGGGAQLPLAETFRRLASLARPEARLMLCALCCMLVGAAAELAVPHFTSRALFIAASGSPRPEFAQAVGALARVAAVYVAFAAARGALFSLLQNRLSRALRAKLFGVLANREAAFFDAHDPGALTSRLTSDCYAISRCVSTNVNVALRNGLQAVGGGVVLFRLSPSLSGAVAGALLVLWAVTVVFGSYSRYSQRVAQDLLAASNASADESFKSARLVRTFGTERVEQRRYGAWLAALYRVGVRQAAAWGLYVVTGTGANLAARVLALLLGGAAVYEGALTPQGLTTYMFYVEFVASASLAVCEQFGSIMEAVGASERVVAALGDPPCAQVAPGDVPPTRLTGRFELRDVWYRYPGRPDAPALQGVSLSLERGQLTALVGLSGSGKSTLVGLLQRLYDPSAGGVFADGVDVRSLDAAWFRAQISVVSQSAPLLSMTVAENIAYGCGCDFAGGGGGGAGGAGGAAAAATTTSGGNGTGRKAKRRRDGGDEDDDEQGENENENGGETGMHLLPAPTRAEVVEAARSANAHDFIVALPLGYDTPVTDRLLSGGQRARVALARALVRRRAARLLVLDEATASLDAQSEALVQAALARAMRERRDMAVLVIAHRLDTVRAASCIHVLDGGRVAEKGTHAELLERRGIYFGLVRRQSGGLAPGDRDLSPGGGGGGAAGRGAGGRLEERGGGKNEGGGGGAGMGGGGPPPPLAEAAPSASSAARDAGAAAAAAGLARELGEAKAEEEAAGRPVEARAAVSKNEGGGRGG